MSLDPAKEVHMIYFDASYWSSEQLAFSHSLLLSGLHASDGMCKARAHGDCPLAPVALYAGTHSGTCIPDCALP
eukprot:1160048-Pelagomonas_calceolata.AAC.6